MLGPHAEDRVDVVARSELDIDRITTMRGSRAQCEETLIAADAFAVVALDVRGPGLCGAHAGVRVKQVFERIAK